MNFKNWFENTDQQNQELKDIVIKFAKENNMPLPTTYLDSGSDAVVFNTTDNDMVVRITKKDNQNSNFCEKIISKPEIQKTGAVVKVFKHSEYENHLITYKEKINTDWELFLANKIPDNHIDISEKLLNLVFDFYDHDELQMSKKIFTLTKYKETKNVALLISRIPKLIQDLHSGNLGVNKDGNIVIIDC